MFTKRKISFVILSMLFLTVFAKILSAHAPDQSYIFLRFQESAMSGRYEITTDDLNEVLDLDLKRGLPVGDLTPHLQKIQEYVLKKSSFSSKEHGVYEIRFTEPSILRGGSLGDYVQLNFELEGVEEIPEKLQVRYAAIFDKLPKHQGMLVIAYDWKAGIHNNEAIPTLVFSSSDTEQDLPTTKSASLIIGFVAMIKLGVWHIWIGFDHILFLFALLLPSVLVSRGEGDLPLENPQTGGWKAADQFKPAFVNVVKIVTCFTIAHTITLSLASLEIVTLPSRLVESIIAISIALAALHNLSPLVAGKEWIIGFFFGLFHGFGFAGVLAEKGFGGDFLIWTLLGFNLGVELGQLVIIAVIFPVLFLLRKTLLYPKILILGSVSLILISIYWFIERAFDIDFPVGGYILRALGMM
ncbi:MAG: hypothetical protein HKN25_16425 [Pyrinomonadaceae bacterium]|nr:hypothetical protein [Pyrinomonadaceae bacterium]